MPFLTERGSSLRRLKKHGDQWGRRGAGWVGWGGVGDLSRGARDGRRKTSNPKRRLGWIGLARQRRRESARSLVEEAQLDPWHDTRHSPNNLGGGEQGLSSRPPRGGGEGVLPPG